MAELDDTELKKTLDYVLTELQRLDNRTTALEEGPTSRVTHTVDFSTYAGTVDFSHPSVPFDVAYSPGIASGGIKVKNGKAVWEGTNVAPVTATAIYNGGVTATDYQEVKVTIGNFPDFDSRNALILRSDSTGANCILLQTWLSLSLNPLRYEVGYMKNGIYTKVEDGGILAIAGSVTVKVGHEGDPLRGVGYAGSRLIADTYIPAAASRGSDYRHWGFMTIADKKTSSPATATVMTCRDTVDP